MNISEGASAAEPWRAHTPPGPNPAPDNPGPDEIPDPGKHPDPPTDPPEDHAPISRARARGREGRDGGPLVLGNKVSLLENGPKTYEAMFRAMRRALHNINLEFYIVEGGEVGKQFADILLERQAQGVQVNLIYDSVGSLDIPREFFTQLAAAGINVVEYNAVNPLHAQRGGDVNQRDHRKPLTQAEYFLRLILPAKTDSALVYYAGRAYYSDLLKAGVKVYERRHALLHAKTSLVDGLWSTTDSANPDWRSFQPNNP